MSNINVAFPISDMTFPTPTVWPDAPINIQKRHAACQPNPVITDTSDVPSTVAVPISTSTVPVITTPPTITPIQHPQSSSASSIRPEENPLPKAQQSLAHGPSTMAPVTTSLALDDASNVPYDDDRILPKSITQVVIAACSGGGFDCDTPTTTDISTLMTTSVPYDVLNYPYDDSRI